MMQQEWVVQPRWVLGHHRKRLQMNCMSCSRWQMTVAGTQLLEEAGRCQRFQILQ